MGRAILQLIEHHISELAKIGFDSSSGGFNRIAYTKEETLAHQYIEEAAASMGFASHRDFAANLYVFPHDMCDKDIVLIGSHLDTVPNGGNYDGVAGVVAGLEAMRVLVADSYDDIALAVWRGEESSRFGMAYLGSSLALGIYGNEQVAVKDKDRISLSDAVAACVHNPDARIMHQALNQEMISCYLEAHIEQARSLESKGIPIGIVTGIRAPVRYMVEVVGRYDHSGATPMGLRIDANRVAANILAQAYRFADKLVGDDRDIVFTSGIIHSDSGSESINKVSGYCKFSVDIRSNEICERDFFEDKLLEIIRTEGEKTGAEINARLLSRSDPIPSLDHSLHQGIERACNELGVSCHYMPSGAGHDAAVLAKAGIPTGLIFIPCLNGRSHCPEEYASPEHVAIAADVLAQTIRNI